MTGEIKRFVVVCTDRGRHKPRTIAVVRLMDDGRRHMPLRAGWRSWMPPGSDNPRGRSRDLYKFSCPDCARQPEIRHDRWWAIVDTVFAAGVSRLDLSNLPL